MELVAILLAAVFIALLVQLLRGNNSHNSSSGASQSARSSASSSSDDRPNRILNNYRTLGEVEAALRKAGLESSDLIIASVEAQPQVALFAGLRICDSTGGTVLLSSASSRGPSSRQRVRVE